MAEGSEVLRSRRQRSDPWAQIRRMENRVKRADGAMGRPEEENPRTRMHTDDAEEVNREKKVYHQADAFYECLGPDSSSQRKCQYYSRTSLSDVLHGASRDSGPVLNALEAVPLETKGRARALSKMHFCRWSPGEGVKERSNGLRAVEGCNQQRD